MFEFSMYELTSFAATYAPIVPPYAELCVEPLPATSTTIKESSLIALTSIAFVALTTAPLI